MRRPTSVAGFLIVAAAILVWAPPAAAQGFGVKGGRLWSDFRGDGDDAGVSYDRVGHWSVGLFTHVRVAGAKLRPEVLYSRRGAGVLDPAASEDKRERFELDYIEIPVVLEFGASPSFFVGGYGAVNVDARLVTEVGGETTRLDLSSSVEEFDYGIVFGVGLRVEKFTIEGRYVQGLRKVFKAGPSSLGARAPRAR